VFDIVEPTAIAVAIVCGRCTARVVFVGVGGVGGGDCGDVGGLTWERTSPYQANPSKSTKAGR
jgi:hypothetical protein